MGHNTVSNLFKGAVKDMGLDMTYIRGAHSLRHHMITTLANDPNVSLKESMKASRHKSMSAHLQYIRSDHTSESQKIASLLKANNAAPVVPDIKKCKTPDPSDSVLFPLTYPDGDEYQFDDAFPVSSEDFLPQEEGTDENHQNFESDSDCNQENMPANTQEEFDAFENEFDDFVENSAASLDSRDVDGHQLSFRPPSKTTTAYTYSFAPSSKKISRQDTTEYSTPAFDRMHAKHGSVNIARAPTTTSTTKRVTPYYSHQQYQEADEVPDHYAVTPVTTRTSVLTRNIVPNSKAPNNMRTARVLPFKNPYTHTRNKTSGNKVSHSHNRFENPYIIKKKTGNVDGGSKLSDLQMQIRKVR